MIGKKINKPITDFKDYATTAIWCNNNNAKIEDKGDYYEVVAIIPQEPTLQEQLEELEHKTGYTRAIRELILANDSGASAYVKSKAQEIENIAEQIRG